MIPYSDFLYFGILLYLALPTLLIRRWLGFSRVWVLLTTAAMLIVQYGTVAHLLPVSISEVVGGDRRSLQFREARGGPDDLGGAGLRPLPMGRGPVFPLDEDAHLLVLALPSGAAVDHAPPHWRPIPAADHPGSTTRVRRDLVPDVPQPGRHLLHPGQVDRLAPWPASSRPSSSSSRRFPRAPSTAIAGSVSTGTVPVPPRKSGRIWMAPSIASSRASCTSSSWRP